eukprot:1152440-Pelagomonas_calceolata.AAC.11
MHCPGRLRIGTYGKWLQRHQEYITAVDSRSCPQNWRVCPSSTLLLLIVEAVPKIGEYAQGHQHLAQHRHQHRACHNQNNSLRDQFLPLLAEGSHAHCVSHAQPWPQGFELQHIHLYRPQGSELRHIHLCRPVKGSSGRRHCLAHQHFIHLYRPVKGSLSQRPCQAHQHFIHLYRLAKGSLSQKPCRAYHGAMHVSALQAQRHTHSLLGRVLLLAASSLPAPAGQGAGRVCRSGCSLRQALLLDATGHLQTKVQVELQVKLLASAGGPPRCHWAPAGQATAHATCHSHLAHVTDHCHSVHATSCCCLYAQLDSDSQCHYMLDATVLMPLATAMPPMPQAAASGCLHINCSRHALGMTHACFKLELQACAVCLA